MSQESTHIRCPNCGQEIDVNEILYHELDQQLQNKYNAELARQQQRYAARERELEQLRQALETDKSEFDARLRAGVEQGLRAQRSSLESQIREQAEQEQLERIEALRGELEDKTRKVRQLNRFKSEIERLQREKDELRDRIELEAQKRLTAQLKEEKEKIRSNEQTRAALEIRERDELISQLKDQLHNAQRKAEQGSTQLRGEAGELLIEEWLAAQFPLDTIEEIKKGAQGADCVQIVNTRSRRNCGSIYYESKRTKSFQPSWIEKFKADIRNKNANIGVLVTHAMPPDMERLGLKEGVWVCTFEEFKGLCVVLRESIIQVSNAISVTENKGDKMGMLYDFLTSNEFRLQIEAIVEGFTQMQIDLEAEKRAMQSNWKRREKQIEKVLLNTNYIYSSVRGIAGNAVQAVPQLELPLDKDAAAE